jgi:hypothetical protein
MTDNELSERVMALSDEIRALRDRTLFDLNSAHDYYADTKNAWRFFEDVISEGRTYRSTNTATGTMTTGAELVIKSRGYVSRQLPEATFQQFIALFESFFFDLLKLWLTAYPQSLGGKKLDFKAVLEAPDKDAITELVVTREVNEVMYDRPAGWFAYLESKVNLGCPSPGEIERIAEAKASRAGRPDRDPRALSPPDLGIDLPGGRRRLRRGDRQGGLSVNRLAILPGGLTGRAGGLDWSCGPGFRVADHFPPGPAQYFANGHEPSASTGRTHGEGAWFRRDRRRLAHLGRGPLQPISGLGRSGRLQRVGPPLRT